MTWQISFAAFVRLKGKLLGNEEGSTACLGARLTAEFGAGTVRMNARG